MSFLGAIENALDDLPEVCVQTRTSFSAYLDGALDGRSMGETAAHMRECAGCTSEFAAWHAVQTVLAEMGPAPLPTGLQAQLRDALAGELSIGRHLAPWRRAVAFSRRTLAPAGLRLGAGFAATLVILGTAAMFLGSALPVQANDDAMAHLKAPKFLYSQTTPEPITSNGSFGAVLVDAKVDAGGKVYDFDLIQGPSDPATRRRIEANLFASVFQPATVFGVPVPGHVMMTYTAVSARG